MVDRPIIPVAISFTIGIITGNYVLIPYSQFTHAAIFILISAILIISLFVHKKIGYPAVVILFFLSGILFVMKGDENSQLLAFAQKREKVILEGTVIEPTLIHENYSRTAVKINKLFLNKKQINTGGKIRVTIYNNSIELLPGLKIRFPARLNVFQNFNNPGSYNYRNAMKSKGFLCQASVSDGRRIVIMGKASLDPLIGILENARGPVRDLFRKKLQSQNSSLLRAIILGEKQSIEPSLREDFNRSGLGHILAVSGLHIGLIAWLVFSISIRLFSFSYYLSLKMDIRKLSAIIACFPVILYTSISGFQISGQRAMIMVLVYLFSIILGREKDIWSSLAFSVLIILGFEPNALFTSSFQLSFIAVIGILWISPVIYNRLPSFIMRIEKKRFLDRVYQYFLGLVIVTLSAMFFLLPLTTFYFNRISLLFLPANVTVIPLLGLWVLPLGLLSSVCAHIYLPLAEILVIATGWGLDLMTAIIRFWAVIPWSSFWTIKPNLFEIILFYSILFTVFHLKKKLWAKICFYVLSVMIILDASYWIYITRLSPKLRITYFDVGQGNSALIQFPGHERMLIDGGGSHLSDFDMGRTAIAPSLWHAKLSKINYLILSHPQSDHVGGLNFIALNFDPDEFWYNGDKVENISFKNLINTVKRKNIPIHLPEDLSNGRKISGVDVKVLYPSKNEYEDFLPSGSRRLNNNSLVIKLSYNGRSFLFPGDIEISGERKLLQNTESALRSDILLVPHHGSKNSCSDDFLKAVKPKLAVISSGRDNPFRFPDDEILERLAKIECSIFRTDKMGSIKLSMDKHEITMESYLNGPMGKLLFFSEDDDE